MKHLLHVWMAALLLTGVAGCEYDDEALWNKVNELEEQVDQNSQTIATLQQLIDALNQGKVIMSVEQTAEGYTLHFSDGSAVSIHHGKDGADGQDGTNGDSYFQSVEVTDDSVIITLSDGTVIELPLMKEDIRVLSFEEGTARFTPYTITGYNSAADNYYDHQVSTWNDLIDTPEYGGPLIYGDMGYMGQQIGCDYYWYEIDDVIGIGDNEVHYFLFPKNHAPVAKVRLATEEMYKLYKAKKLGMDELLLLTEKSLLAQGALYRLENKIRSFRSSISDLAVRHETAKQRWALAKGRGTSLAAGKLEYEVLDLAFQLQSSRIYSNPLWKSAFDAYCKAPGKASYLAMLKAEAEAAPRRRF